MCSAMHSARVDYLNLGFAGNALMEEEMARYLVSRRDWDFASVEMGINTTERVKEFPLEVFEERIDRFTAVLARDPRPVFATSFFGYLDEDTDRTDKMRRIVRRYAAERLIFTDGLQLLDDETLSRRRHPPRCPRAGADRRTLEPHHGGNACQPHGAVEFFWRLSFCTNSA